MKPLDSSAVERGRKRTREAYDALFDALRGLPSPILIQRALIAYEETGDHDHGRGRLRPGEACAGGDCLVHEARCRLAKLWGVPRGC